jgi:hypothetical protein
MRSPRGVDVAKEPAVACVRMPPAAGRKHRTSHLQTVPATVPAIGELAAELVALGVQMVSMEATSDYWRIWVRHEAHCCIARSAGGNRRRCFSDLMAYLMPKGLGDKSMVRREALYRIPCSAGRNLVECSWV